VPRTTCAPLQRAVFAACPVSSMKFFVEPVILAINYAKTLGYKRIVMVGLSGGGWTTTVAAAIDPRIDLSIPVAGSLPFGAGSVRSSPPSF
jgi:dienelactone hydrolase